MKKVLTHKLTGFEEFEKLLEELPVRTQKKVVQKATLAAMRTALKPIRAAAPRGEPDKRSPISKKFGPLNKNIKLTRLKNVKRWEKGARIHTVNAPQGFWYEKGTRYQPARPWFQPEFTGLVEPIIKVLGDVTGEGIKREAKRK